MSGAAAFWMDNDGDVNDYRDDATGTPGEMDDQFPGDGDADDERDTCSWCLGPLPDWEYLYCSETCRVAARSDAA